MGVDFVALPVPIVDESADERTPWLAEELAQRFQPTEPGLILENRSRRPPTYFIRVSEFELWLGVDPWSASRTRLRGERGVAPKCCGQNSSDTFLQASTKTVGMGER